MSIDTFLSKLDKVKSTGKETWTASCPAHDDKTPSLSITEKEDGTVMFHCFAGCNPSSVVTAVGLEFSDLYPEKQTHHRKKRKHQRHNPRDVLRIMARESLVVAIGAAQLANGETVTPEVAERLATASERLQRAAEVANGKS